MKGSGPMRTLYRPVGLYEMKLILDTGLSGFPPRLPEQPIFYPVLNKPYADQIAYEWNTKEKFSGYVGYVTRFEVDKEYLSRFEEQVVGAAKHAELWVPAEDLQEFNRHIQGGIRVVDAFFGSQYQGLAAENTFLAGLSAGDQLVEIGKYLQAGKLDWRVGMDSIWKHLYLNYRYWLQLEVSDGSFGKDSVLSEIRAAFIQHRQMDLEEGLELI
jgi:hypothetical protein